MDTYLIVNAVQLGSPCKALPHILIVQPDCCVPSYKQASFARIREERPEKKDMSGGGRVRKSQNTLRGSVRN